MSEATIYTTSWCPSCVNAKAFFDNREVPYTEIDVEQWDDPRGRLETITGQRTVPQIVIGETLISGFDGLLALHQDGALDGLLTASV